MNNIDFHKKEWFIGYSGFKSFHETSTEFREQSHFQNMREAHFTIDDGVIHDVCFEKLLMSSWKIWTFCWSESPYL